MTATAKTTRAMRLTLLAGVWCAAAGAAGCGDAPVPPAKTADDGPPAALSAPKPGPAAAARQDQAKPTSGSIQIDDRIMKACGDLPTAQFAFDSAAIADQAAAVLDALSRCFVSGPLKGKGLKLVGHTDERGETQYNFALGHKRAASVADYLAQKGLEPGRIAKSSRGEIEASGQDENGWARDRKVEILLGD